MNVVTDSKFAASSDFEKNIYSRYLIIQMTPARRGLFVAFLVGLWTVFVVFTDYQGALARAYEIPALSFHRYLKLFGLYVMPVLTPFLFMLLVMFSSEKTFSDKYFKRQSKHIKIGVDMPSCGSILYRTKYRYCASLKVNGKNMVVQDKVSGLINGKLRLKDVGEDMGDEIVQLNLTVDQITGMWISRDAVILRFCWGETYQEAWDIILKRSSFTEGKDREFIKFVKGNIRRKKLTYDYVEAFSLAGQFRLANKSTNQSYPWTQRRVKISHNFWGPF